MHLLAHKSLSTKKAIVNSKYVLVQNKTFFETLKRISFLQMNRYFLFYQDSCKIFLAAVEKLWKEKGSFTHLLKMIQQIVNLILQYEDWFGKEGVVAYSFLKNPSDFDRLPFLWPSTKAVYMVFIGIYLLDFWVSLESHNWACSHGIAKTIVE